MAQPAVLDPPLTAAERAARSVFVGNIPYEATEEQLKEIFTQAGPVVSFRLVYDRETGKPKGYGFCEYQDIETAQSAMRNLHSYDFNGRPLRVGVAAGEQNKDEIKGMQQAVGGPIEESPYGEKVEPSKAPEAISKAVASLPPEQMFELMKQMKLCIQNNPTEARNMLLQNPQLAYALLQAQIVMKIVDPQVALAMLHRQREQVPPTGPEPVAAPPASQTAPSTMSQAQPMEVNSPMASSSRMGPSGPPINSMGMQGISDGPRQNLPPQQMGHGGRSGPPPGLLGDRPPSHMGNMPPQGPGNRGPPTSQGPPMGGPGPRMGDQRGDFMGGPQGMGMGGPQMGGPQRMPGMPPSSQSLGGPMQGGPMQGGPRPGRPDQRDPRGMGGGHGELRGMGGVPNDPRGMGGGAPPLDHRGMGGAPGASRGMGGMPNDPRGDNRGGIGGPGGNHRGGMGGPGPQGDLRGMGRAGADPRGMGAMPPGQDNRGGGPPGDLRGLSGAPGDPRNISSRPPGPPVSMPNMGDSPGVGSHDQEKAALIMQVLQLSDEQIAMLPPDQRHSILILKEQISRSAGP